jgi:hypothetical protein
MFCNGEPRSRIMAAFNSPRRAQVGMGDHPLQEPPAVQSGLLGDDLRSPTHTGRLRFRRLGP